MKQAESLELKELLKKAVHDEGYCAGELAAEVRRLGGRHSSQTGDFVEKVRVLPGLKCKLELLNRGQRWVIRKPMRFSHIYALQDDFFEYQPPLDDDGLFHDWNK